MTSRSFLIDIVKGQLDHMKLGAKKVEELLSPKSIIDDVLRWVELGDFDNLVGGYILLKDYITQKKEVDEGLVKTAKDTGDFILSNLSKINKELRDIITPEGEIDWSKISIKEMTEQYRRQTKIDASFSRWRRTAA